MKGKYQIIVQNNRVKFEFEIKRNITVIRGDSATGKTTLMNLLETYERLGDESGVSVSCQKSCKTINNSNWESVIEAGNECIIFADEDTRAVTSEEFAAKIKGSDNYFVLITRENLSNLPYSVEEIYGIHTAGKYADIRQTYNTFFRLYGGRDLLQENDPVDVLVVEDSNAGFDFFKAISSDKTECIPAGGKSRIKKKVRELKGKKVLAIADGAAFGSEMGRNREVYFHGSHAP